MRIIGGNHKGRIINTLTGFKERPTTDFAKESLFNILNNYFYFEDLKVLDLFAGSGNISFEFASRGSKQILAVDKSKKYADYIENQAEEIFSDNPITTISADVFEFAKNHPLEYDLIFADPPYKLENIEKLPDIIFENKYVKDNTLFVFEHSKYLNFKEHLLFQKEKKYGYVHFSFFSKEKF